MSRVRTETVQLGPVDVYVAHPTTPGPHPGIVVLEEAFGRVEHIEDLCRRPGPPAIAGGNSMNWMLLPLKRYADFNGRSRRLEYWMFHLAVSIVDPDNMARYLEVRATVSEIVPDPTAAEYDALSRRYGRGPQIPPDAADRVVILATPYHVTVRG